MAEQIYVARVTANALAAGRFVVLVAGEPVELSATEAEELLRVRFVVKATKGMRTPGARTEDDDHENADESEGQGAVSGETVSTAALAPQRTATAAAQNAKSRKGSGL